MKIRFGLTGKAIAALLVMALTLVALLAGVLYWSLERGFLDYVRRIELERLDPLASALIAEYSARNDWDWLRGRARLWRYLVRRNRDPDLASTTPPLPGRGRQGPWQRPSQLGLRFGPHPPPISEEHDQAIFQGRGDRPHLRQPEDQGKTPLRRPPPAGLLRRLTLLDAEGRPVIGPLESPPDALLRPLEHAGSTIGWLRLRPLPGLTREIDLDFQMRQSRIIQISALGALLLAPLVAVLLARHFLGPIRTLTRNMATLTSGRFDTRTEICRRDELGELADGFNRLAQTLEQNETLRRRWVADIAHELRTPLAILTGEIDAVAEGIRPWDQSAQASLQAEVAILTKLIEDLHQLALSDLGALTYRMESLALEDLLEQVIARHTKGFELAGLQLRRDLATPPSRIIGDQARLTQLFDNLFQNSLRYTDPGGRLTIATRRLHDRAIIDLQDSAPGVPAEAMSHLFERFYRVDKSRSRAQGGAGLGLAICHNIITAHDGSIAARPSPLGGLWIAISLPLGQYRERSGPVSAG